MKVKFLILYNIYMKTYYKSFGTKIGALTIIANDEAVLEIKFGIFIPARNKNYINKENKVIAQAMQEINEYLNKERKVFDVNVSLKNASEFKKKVLTHTLDIEYGKHLSYGDISKKLNKGCARAVGSALKTNPIPILIPCHRVIGKSNPYAYNGGEQIKKNLIFLESINLNNH